MPGTLRSDLSTPGLVAGLTLLQRVGIGDEDDAGQWDHQTCCVPWVN